MFKEYFYGNFRQELAAALTDSPLDIQRCRHCGVPPQRRTLARASKLRGPEFFLCWWGLTLLDQGLHRYFPREYEIWQRSTGGYPVPVEYRGFGCVGTLAPRKLVEYYCKQKLSDQLLEEFCKFFAKEVNAHFEKLSGVSCEVFFKKIRNDPDFGPLEQSLMERVGVV
jgi:hypothetical protein